MTWHSIHRKTSSNWSAPKSQFSSRIFGSKHPEVQKSQFAPRSFAPVEQDGAKEDIADNKFPEKKFVATPLTIQARYNTPILSGQERANLLQAQMNSKLLQRASIAQHQPNTNLADSPITPAEPIQTKLTVDAPGDKYETVAGTMAHQVMSMPDSAVQREIVPEKTEEEVQTKPLAAGITQRVEREAMPEEEEVQAKSLNASIQREVSPEEEEVQTKPLLQLKSDTSFQAGGNIESQLNNSACGGSPLGDEVRGFMEPRFGADFSQVRVHTGGDAVQMNRELGAQAFAHGSDIYFGAGKSPGNNELTAHELTHVVQQTGGVQTKLNGISLLSNYDRETFVSRVPAPAAGVTPLFPPPPSKTKNIRFTIAADKEADWWTPAWYSDFQVGHSWIMIQTPDGAKDSFGFWPANLGRGGGFDPKHPWRDVDGEVRHPDTAHQPTTKKTVLIDVNQLKKGTDFADSMSGAKYNLLNQNCTTFARNMFSLTTGQDAPYAGTLIEDPNDLANSISAENKRHGLDAMEEPIKP